MRRLPGFPTWILAFLVAALGSALPAARAADQPPAPAEGTDAADTPADERAGAQRSEDARPGWWNQPTISSTLSVTDAQRQKMDSHLDAYFEALRGEGRELAGAFQEALRAGDWKKARADLAQLAEQVGVPIRAQGELKIQVLSELSDAQRKTLLEKYPRLIERPWVRAAQGGRQGGQGRQPGGPR